MKNIVILNGAPESGKDEFAKFIGEILNKKSWDSDDDGMAAITNNNNQSDYIAHHISSVGPVKEMLEQYFGWDGVTKDEFWRKAMVDLKQLWINICDGPTKYILEYVLKLERRNLFLFIDIRESTEITKAVSAFRALKPMGIDICTVLLRRKNKTKQWYNESDDRVDEYGSYNFIINNDGALHQLKHHADNFIKTVIDGFNHDSQIIW